MIEFESWPKTPRLFRDVVVTEKIDGTNAAVIVEPLSEHLPADGIFTRREGKPPGWDYAEKWLLGEVTKLVDVDGEAFLVGAQSRSRLIAPGADNFGFAAWVWESAEDLARHLGPGRHFGEWWGSGIQRGYGLPKGEKRFSLFNVARHEGIAERSGGLVDVVPTLYEGVFDEEELLATIGRLHLGGSVAAPGFDRPEGVVLSHTQSRQVYKVLIENDDVPKGAAA